MKITIKKQTEATIDIELPSFWGSGDHTDFIAVINDKTAIKIMTSKDGKYRNLQNGDAWLFKNDIDEAYKNWISISETEFLEVHESFLQSLSLMPKMIVD